MLLAGGVQDYVDQQHAHDVLVRIRSRDAWPHTAAAVLRLQKHGIRVHVEDDWLFLFGYRLAEPRRRPAGELELVFVSPREGAAVAAEAGFVLAVREPFVVVYARPRAVGLTPPP